MMPAISLKRFAALGCAGVLSLSLVAMTPQEAEARNAGAFAAGVVAGVVGALIIGGAAQGGHYTYQGHRYGWGEGPAWRAHYNWCRSHYRSWNPRTNQFRTYSGRLRHCRSPYLR